MEIIHINGQQHGFIQNIENTRRIFAYALHTHRERRVHSYIFRVCYKLRMILHDATLEWAIHQYGGMRHDGFQMHALHIYCYHFFVVVLSEMNII